MLMREELTDFAGKVCVIEKPTSAREDGLRKVDPNGRAEMQQSVHCAGHKE